MAAKRSIPTNLFSSPDFFELSSDTIRLIMIGLILDADDEGRGSAHPRLLARKLDKCPKDIEQALGELQAHGILQGYEVAGRAYYVLCHWHTYQTLSKPTPSTYPAPPGELGAESYQSRCGKPRVPQESPGYPAPEGEGGKEQESELEEKGKRNEDEEEIAPPGTVPLSAPRSDRAGVSGSLPPENKEVETDQVAFYLQLPLSTELEAVVREFRPSSLSLIGEAIEARSWVNDPRRNRKGQPMTVAFFRRWLKRSRGDYGAPEQGQGQARVSVVGIGQKGPQKAAVPRPSASSQPDDPYQAYFVRRLAEVKAEAQKKLGVVA